MAKFFGGRAEVAAAGPAVSAVVDVDDDGRLIRKHRWVVERFLLAENIFIRFDSLSLVPCRVVADLRSAGRRYYYDDLK